MIAQYRFFRGSDTGDTLFRPHYWASQDGQDWQHDMTASFLRAHHGSSLTKERVNDSQVVHVHGGVSYPNNFSVEDLLPTSYQSIAFWILVHNPVTSRYALTLYWLVTQDDHEFLSRFGGDFSTFGGYITSRPSLRSLCFPFR